MKSLEADLLKTAAKEAKDGLMGKAANTMLISASYQEKDEKQLRDKLVTKLKQKAEDRMATHDKRLRKKEAKRSRLRRIADGEDVDDEEDEEFSDDSEDDDGTDRREEAADTDDAADRDTDGEESRRAYIADRFKKHHEDLRLTSSDDNDDDGHDKRDRDLRREDR